jgi:ribonucleoside-diphosphate reductase alpha chain
MAAEAWAKKYALRDPQDKVIEKTPNDMFDRMARALASVEEDQDRWFRIFREHLAGFDKLVMQGSPMAGLGNHRKVSLSNCFVIESPEDSIQGIYKAVYKMAQIQAYRGGVGLDVSNLRPEGGPVSNAAGSSSGAWNWCDQFSYTSRKIGQRGRIGALMLTMRVDHPDILSFIKMKSDLQMVTGANISVRITDKFMEAVDNDGEIDLWFNYNSDKYEDYRQKVKAREIWGDIVHYATTAAEPGILMWDNIINGSPSDCYADEGFVTISTNPCSEIPLCANDACRLASVHLPGFVRGAFTNRARFDFESFAETVKVGVRALDNIVDLDNLPFLEQQEMSGKGRRIGLGTHGLADCLLKLNLKYDSDEALEFIDKLYAFLKNTAYDASVDLAVEKGPFPIYDAEKERKNGFIGRIDEKVKARMEEHGRRNIALLTCAPTGTVSMMSQSSSGIEPIFRLAYKRRVKLNHGEDRTKADFVDDTGDAWTEHQVLHHALREFLEHKRIPEDDLNCDELPEQFITSDCIDWDRRVDIQATMQRHIDHGISSTINLPEGTSEEIVGRLYMQAWKKGLKGVTVYVEGSRSGVLVDEKEIKRKPAPKRPKELDAMVHVAGSNGSSYNVIIGFLEGVIYEVFCLKQKDAGMIDGIKGKIVKHRGEKSARYDFESGRIVIREINRYEDSEISSFTRILSTALRHGVPLEMICEQLFKSRGSVTHIAKSLNRVFSIYVGTIRGVQCMECGSDNTVMEEACFKCLDCQASKCS